MLIHCPITIRGMSKEEFGALDYAVMRCAFETQKALGRLCDEQVYRNGFAARLGAAGIGQVQTEVPISVSFRDFNKVYRIDLLLNHAAVYELKAAAALVPKHEAQLLHYLFLLDGERGKLVNFRPAKVESSFVNNPVRKDARWKIDLDDGRWTELGERSVQLRELVIALLLDWGGYLDFALYTEALTHLLGGNERVSRMVPLQLEDTVLGNQRVLLLDEKTAFRVNRAHKKNTAL